MQLITVSGPPSSGKTSVILHMIRSETNQGKSVGVIKLDCLSTEDDVRYRKAGIPIYVGLSGSLCPDHYFASNIEECLSWGENQKLELMMIESAGLCNRCSPHIKGISAVCVIDNLMGVKTPKKIGPMLKMADVVVITKGDVVSQAEREVFAFHVRCANPKAMIMQINGITGQGCEELADIIQQEEDTDWKELRLRFPMPAAICSYCLGETRMGSKYHIGNIKRMEIE